MIFTGKLTPVNELVILSVSEVEEQVKTGLPHNLSNQHLTMSKPLHGLPQRNHQHTSRTGYKMIK